MKDIRHARLKDQEESIPEQFYLLLDLTDFAVQYSYESFEDLSDNLDRIKYCLPKRDDEK